MVIVTINNMLNRFILLVLILSQYQISCTDPEIEDEELRARDYMRILDHKTGELKNRITKAEWEYASNLTQSNLHHKLSVQADVENQTKELWQETTQFKYWKVYADPILKRQFKKYLILGVAALSQNKRTRYNQIISDMERIYSTAKICDYHQNATKCDLSLEPDLTNILANSRDPDELKHVWVEWRKATGPNCFELFKDYVELSNQIARANNFTDNTEYWLEELEDPQIRNQIESIWEELRPLYLQIHAYVRYQLRKKYGDIVSEKGPIPAHLLGNMWSQTWEHVEDFTLPYPNKQEENLSEELQKQNYTVSRIFRTAEDFFKSINLSAMPESFWNLSILEKPEDRELICHASAWDFYDGKDVRIKQCTQVTLDHFITAHHEMGHVEYFLQYKNQPVIFRRGANSGFHEAVGDLIALSVQSRKHLRKLGLIKSETDDPENILNSLFQVGLSKIVFLPFGYLMDLWRWDVFSGKITPDEYNCKWWELREKYQGIEPPVDRTDKDFDPAAKYHIVADVPYIRYFISFVIQFQFHRAVCEKAGQYDPNDPSKPLHNCDIYQNKEAGDALKQLLELGSSRPWPDAMEILTGQRSMDASALLEYFTPLKKWLEQENRKNNVHIGWEKSNKACIQTKKDDNQE